LAGDEGFEPHRYITIVINDSLHLSIVVTPVKIIIR